MDSLEGKRILVTGGTGSLGKVLVSRLLSGAAGKPAKITVFSRDEAKQHDMRLEYLNRRPATDEVIYGDVDELLSFRIGDVRDYASVVTAVRRADVVFHAAALKQVPNCEYFPYEAVLTNVIGAQNVVRAIRDNQNTVELVVGISTDKAAKPINVMGMTKALQERLFVVANMECDETRFVCVRYGNVIASRGSILPLFTYQIEQGGPVTVTMKEMTRFFLSLEQAVDTILAAAKEGLAGDTYIPKVPAARVVDIAAALIDGRDIEVVYTGIRPGEKIHEILVSEEERYRTLERGDYYVIQASLPELRQQEVDEPPFDGEYSSANVTLDQDDLRAMLSEHIANSRHGVAG